MKRDWTTRILSLLLLVSLLLVEVSPTLSYAAEVTADQGDTLTLQDTEEETLLQEEEPEQEQPETPAEPSEEEEGDLGEDGTEEAVPETPPEEPESPAEDAPSSDTDAPSQETPSEEVPGDGATLEPEEQPEDAMTEAGMDEEPVEEETLTPEEAAEQAAMAELEQILQMALAMRTSDADYDYATELAKFPASYQTYLKELHQEHPNWIFVAVDTGLEWDDVIEGELGEKSTLDYTYSDLLLNNHDGYYSTSGYSGTNGYRPIDSNHVSCSRAALAYYMDPRNFLLSKYIFQFEDQQFNRNVQSLSGVRTILKNACSYSTGLYNMTTYVNTSGKKVSLASLGSSYGSNYSDIIYNVGLAIGISPYFLASKIAQETGANTTNGSISGTYSGYTGYYNFYNIGAYASANGGAIAKGLSYAKSKGWSNPVLAIYGGAEYIYNQYIGKGQNTIYYMRFNVSPEADYSLYTHQYMSATYAVAGEATKTYNAYNEVGAVDNAFLFYIPVYRNMPDKTAKVSLTPKTTGKTNTSCGLYSGPSTSTSKLVQVPSGASVTVLSGTVTSTDNYTSRLTHPYWYQIQVTVSGKTYTGYVDEENVDLSAVYNIKKGSTKSLSSVLSTSGKTGTLYYETSDPGVATVSDSGIITAKGNGTCSIYVISGGGSFDAIGLTVSNSGSTSNDGESGTTGTVPVAPDVTSLANGDGYIRVAWEKVSNATGYTVWRKVGNAAAWNKIATIDSGSTVVYNDTNVSNNTDYTYTIRAVNGAGLSDYDHTGKGIRYLATPELTQAKAYSDGIGVQWKTVSGAVSYDLYRKTGSGAWHVLVNLPAGSGSIQGYTDGTAQKGTTYSYTVRAKTSSTQSYYRTSGVSAKAITTAPVETSYANGTLNYRTGAGLNYSAAGSFASGALVQVIPNSGVSVSGTTWYQVRVNGGSIYYVSGAYLVMTPVLKQAVNTGKGIRVTWETSNAASGYLVYRKSGSSGWVRIATTTAGQYDDTSVSNGTTYIYTVRAQFGGKLSDYDRDGVKCTYQQAENLGATKLKQAVNISGGIRVTWETTSGATSYLVYRKSGSSGWVRIATTTAGQYDDTSVSAGTTYVYTVRTLIGGNLSDYDRNGVKCTYQGTSTTQAATKLKQAVNIDGGIRITWEPTSGATSYLVYRKSGSSGWVRIATTTTAGQYDDTSVSSGTTYVYTVRTLIGGNLSDYDRNGVKCLCLDTPVLTGAQGSGSSIQVTWQKVTGATGYTVWRKVGSGAWEKLSTLSSGSTTSYQDRTAKSGTTYTYTIRAINGSTMSQYDRTGLSASLTSGATTSNGTLEDQVVKASTHYYSAVGSSSAAGTLSGGTVVKVVTNWSQTNSQGTWLKVQLNGSYYYVLAAQLLETPKLTGAANTNNGMQVSWNRVSDGDGYTVWRKAGNAAAWNKIATLTSNSSTTYVDRSVTSGTKYAYTVRATYGSVQSRYSNSGVSCLRLDTPDLTQASGSASGITVAWSKVTGATQYLVYRKTSGASWQRIAQITSTSYTDQSNLSAGVTYYYTVRAYGDSVLSGYDTGGIGATTSGSTGQLVNYVTTGMLNYRSSPDKSSSSNIVGSLASGATVKIVSGWSKQVDDTLWYQCYLNGHYYYLSSKYLKKA